MHIWHINQLRRNRDSLPYFSSDGCKRSSFEGLVSYFWISCKHTLNGYLLGEVPQPNNSIVCPLFLTKVTLEGREEVFLFGFEKKMGASIIHGIN